MYSNIESGYADVAVFYYIPYSYKYRAVFGDNAPDTRTLVLSVVIIIDYLYFRV